VDQGDARIGEGKPFGRLRPLSVLGSDPSRKATRLLLKNSADQRRVAVDSIADVGDVACVDDADVEQRRCNAAGPIHRRRSGPCSVRAREEGTEIVQQATRARFSALDGVQPVEVDALFGVGQPCLLGAGLQHDGGQRG
jgi:hypothetical protein